MLGVQEAAGQVSQAGSRGCSGQATSHTRPRTATSTSCPACSSSGGRLRDRGGGDRRGRRQRQAPTVRAAGWVPGGPRFPSDHGGRDPSGMLLTMARLRSDPRWSRGGGDAPTHSVQRGRTRDSTSCPSPCETCVPPRWAWAGEGGAAIRSLNWSDVRGLGVRSASGACRRSMMTRRTVLWVVPQAAAAVR